MIMRLARRWRRRPVPPDWFHVTVGAGTLLAAGFSLDIRSGPRENRLVVGENSMLQCQITFERAVGTIKIGSNTYIGGSHLICADQIEIGSDVLIAWGCTLIDHNAHSIRWSERADDLRAWREGLRSDLSVAADLKNWSVVPMAPLHIEDKAWIGFNSILLKGVTVGQGAIVGAGSVVTKDIPPWTIAGGNPARVIRELEDDER
jgi:acetyltransferase-like isoleucine patch superfamily enzyme